MAAIRNDSLMAAGCRCFLMVAETGSVRAAARLTNTAASAISRQISLLEEKLDILLFDRSGKSLTLSPAGEELLRGLTASALMHEQTLDQLNALRGLKSGRVRIATVESISVTFLPGMLEAFAKVHPGLQVMVTVASSDAVTELVRDHAADVGLTFNPATFEGLEVAHTVDFPLGAVVSKKHELAKHTSVTLRECLQYPVAWPARGLSLRNLLDPFARKARTLVRPAFECNSLRVMAGLAERGVCIAFQTPIGIERELAEGTLCFIPLSDRRLPADQLMIVARSGLDGRTAANAFLVHAKSHVAAMAFVHKNRTRRA